MPQPVENTSTMPNFYYYPIDMPLPGQTHVVSIFAPKTIHIYFTPCNLNAIKLLITAPSVFATTTIVIDSIVKDRISFIPELVITKVCDEGVYEYGYNGQQKDNEWSGNGNHNNALFWEYDTRSARRGNVDPFASKFPAQSPYCTFDDNPIVKADPLGNYTKFGARWRNFVNGGAGIEYTVSTGEWSYHHNSELDGTAQYSDGRSFNIEPFIENDDIVYSKDMPNMNGEYNLMAAAHMQIGRNDEMRQRSDMLQHAAMGYLVFGTTATVAVGVGIIDAPAVWSVAKAAIYPKFEFNLISGTSDFAAQMYTNSGNLKEWNVLNTIGATFSGNPFTASLPGGFFKLTYNNATLKDRTIIQSNSFETWKGIALNTLGNMLGDKAESLYMMKLEAKGAANSYSSIFVKFAGQQTGDVPSGVVDDMTNSKQK